MIERDDLSDRHDPQLEDTEGEPADPKVVRLHGRDFAGASFAANEDEQTKDKADPEYRPDIDDDNTVPRIQDHGLNEP